jgi:hypothetical protein
MYIAIVIILIANKHLLQQMIFIFQGYAPVSPVVVFVTMDEYSVHSSIAVQIITTMLCILYYTF